jgi:hypothetical protein
MQERPGLWVPLVGTKPSCRVRVVVSPSRASPAPALEIVAEQSPLPRLHMMEARADVGAGGAVMGNN